MSARSEAATITHGPRQGHRLTIVLSRHLAAPAVAFVLSWVLFAIRSGAGLAGVFKPATWARSDSHWYVFIAEHGYVAQWHCGGRSIPPHLPPGNYLCGTIAWFPGYPAMMRGTSEVTRLSVPAAGLLLAWVFWFVLLVAAWRLLEDAVSAPTRWCCLLLVAFLPGAIYLAALFPVSMTLAAMAGCLYFAFRSESRWAVWAAFGCGLVAGDGYISALALCPALLAGLIVAGRRRWRAVGAAVLGVLAGFGAVLLAAQASVGIWDGYFIAQSKYGTGSHNPLWSWWQRVRLLWHSHLAKQGYQHAVAATALYTGCLVALAVLVLLVTALRADRRAEPLPAVQPGDVPRRGSAWAAGGRLLAALRSRLDPLDVAAVATALGAWVLAYGAGARIAFWRSGAFTVFAVLAFRRLRAPLLVVPVVIAAVLAWGLAHFFFAAYLS
jgi:hypothetical protein